MLKLSTTALLFSVLSLSLHAQSHDLIGYWQNWNDASAPYIQLDQIDPRYTVIEIAFAEPAMGTTYDMVFTPSEVSQATFITQVATLQSQGKKVLISIGGANATVQLNSDAERDQFVSSMLGIIGTYGFDGMDIDLEGASVNITGGTIAAPVDAPIIRLIDAIDTIAQQFEDVNGEPMMLTMAPETAYVQGGMSAFGGIWGAYLPIIDALRDRISILQVQLYNSGSMYGIDGGIYTQGTADFIVSQTEALLQGFTTSGGAFAPLPPEKVAIGLPACPSAAGGGYVSPATLASAVNYLLGTGPQPGSYVRVSTYPTLRGLMTWSINWDALDDCATTYEYAQSYEDLFGISTEVGPIVASEGFTLFPNPCFGEATIQCFGLIWNYEVLDARGAVVRSGRFPAPQERVSMPSLPAGIYMVQVRTAGGESRSQRLVVQ